MNLDKSHDRYIKIPTTVITSIVATIFSIPLYADEDELFFEMPVVLSASRLNQPVSEAPMAVTSIDRQLIEASGARTIPEILRLVPGVVVGNNANEWGEESKMVVAYHGHTDQYSKQMQVLIDGRSIYEPMQGGVNWNMLPINIEDIERIEVSRGPNASTFGSNSFLAVINIITRHASEDSGHYANFRAGNHDIADLTYRYGGNSGDLDYRVTLSTQNDNGLDARKNTSTYNLADGSVDIRQYSDENVENNDDISTGAIDYRIDYQINNKNQLTYQGGYGKTDLEIKKNYALDGIRPVRESNTTNAHQFIKLENTVNNKNSFVIQYYYNLNDKIDQSISDLIQVGTIAGIPIDDFTLDLNFGFKSERHNFEFTHFNQTTDQLRLIWGISAQQDIVESKFWLNNQAIVRKETYRLFANSEWRINQKNLLNFGALIEDNNTLGTQVSPRLALIHKLNNKHSLRAGISRAIRSPFIIEEFGNSFYSHDLTTAGGTPTGITLVEQQLVPNDELHHEIILSRELGYFGHFMNDTLFLNARLFHDRLDNLIQTENTAVATDNFDGSAGIYKNLNSTDVTGLEVEFDLRADTSLRFFGNFTYLKIKSNDIPGGFISLEYENSAPDWTASLMALKQFNEIYSGSIEFHYIGEMRWMDVPGTTVTDFSDDSYRIMDLRLSKSIRQSGHTTKLSLVLKNVLGEYSSYNPAPDDGPLVEHNLTGYVEYSVLFN